MWLGGLGRGLGRAGKRACIPQLFAWLEHGCGRTPNAPCAQTCDGSLSILNLSFRRVKTLWRERAACAARMFQLARSKPCVSATRKPQEGGSLTCSRMSEFYRCVRVGGLVRKPEKPESVTLLSVCARGLAPPAQTSSPHASTSYQPRRWPTPTYQGRGTAASTFGQSNSLEAAAAQRVAGVLLVNCLRLR